MVSPLGVRPYSSSEVQSRFRLLLLQTSYLHKHQSEKRDFGTSEWMFIDAETPPKYSTSKQHTSDIAKSEQRAHAAQQIAHGAVLGTAPEKLIDPKT